MELTIDWKREHMILNINVKPFAVTVSYMSINLMSMFLFS
jgi:hypothetical protein